jgi:hypothetical protein
MNSKVRRLSIITLAFLALVIVSITLADAADASPRIRAGGCDVYRVDTLDPIAKTDHRHAFTGGRVENNDTTGFEAQADGFTSCNSEDDYATSVKWYPCAKRFCPDKDTLYYRDPGDTNNLQPIPTDLRLISHTVTFKRKLTTVRFANCLKTDSDGQPILTHDGPDDAVDAGKKPCPAGYKYRIPQPSILIKWPKRLTASTPVSTGSGDYGPAGKFMHADYLAANQPEFNDLLIDLCLNNDVADRRCGVGP